MSKITTAAIKALHGKGALFAAWSVDGQLITAPLNRMQASLPGSGVPEGFVPRDQHSRLMAGLPVQVEELESNPRPEFPVWSRKLSAHRFLKAELDGEKLLDTLLQCRFACSDGERMTSLNGVCISSRRGKTEAVATDGTVMHLVELGQPLTPEVEIWVPKEAIDLLKKVKATSLRLEYTRHLIQIANAAGDLSNERLDQDCGTLHFRCADGDGWIRWVCNDRYPGYEAIIPMQSRSTYEVELAAVPAMFKESKAMLDGYRKSRMTFGEGAIRVGVDNSDLQLENHDIGGIPCRHTDGEIYLEQIGVNLELFASAAAHYPGKATMRLNSAVQAIVLEQPGKLSCVMPLRLPS